MKKATIKRRKRVIPAGEEDEAETATQVSVQEHEETPERGTINADGSVNLGSRRGAPQPMAIEPRPPVQQLPRQASPMSISSDLAAYHQQSLRPRNMPPFMSDDNKLPPITSMQGTGVDRQSSMSPASFLSPARKRSYSSTETDLRNMEDGGNDHPKRLSSIKSILNPSQNGARQDDRVDYALPPLRSPGPPTVHSAPSPGMYSSRDPTPAVSDIHGENEHTRAERRAALQREAERMREMLAAKERELLAMGE